MIRPPLRKFWYLTGYFCSRKKTQKNKEAIKNMYNVSFAIEIVVLFKDVHGAAGTVARIVAAVTQDDLRRRRDVTNHRTTGPSQGTQKVMHIIVLLRW